MLKPLICLPRKLTVLSGSVFVNRNRPTQTKKKKKRKRKRDVTVKRCGFPLQKHFPRNLPLFPRYAFCLLLEGGKLK